MEKYKVVDARISKSVFRGTVEECTTYISQYGIGWSFLSIEDITPTKPAPATIKTVNHEYKTPNYISTKLPDYKPAEANSDRRRNN